MSSRVAQLEVGPQDCGQRGCIVSHDRQSAAPLRAVQSEGTDDDITSGLNGFLEPIDIGGLIGLISQEMKGRTVVPQVVNLGWLPRRDICNHPFDVNSPVAKTQLGCITSGGGKIQNRNVPNISVDQGINES